MSITTKKAKYLGLEDLRYDIQVTSSYEGGTMTGQAIRFQHSTIREDVTVVFFGYGSEGEATMTTRWDQDVIVDRAPKSRPVHFGSDRSES